MGAPPGPLGLSAFRERLLLRRLKRRDERAFQELVRLYQHQIFNLVFRLLGSTGDAEDVAQEVFVTVFKSIDTFRGEAKFSTWLYRIAANQCKNRLRYLGRRHARDTGPLTEAVELAHPESSSSAIASQIDRPDRALEGMQMERLVQTAIADLDEEQRVVLVLRDVEELSYQDIASITGLAEGTVKSRLHRARLALKESISRRMEPTR